MFWTIKQEISEDAERLWERMKDVRDLEAKMSHDGYLKLYQLRSVPQASSAHVSTSSFISSGQYLKLYQLFSCMHVNYVWCRNFKTSCINLP